MKILLILNNKTDACQYFRQTMPHVELNKKKDFEIIKTDNPVYYPDKKLKEFDMVICHKSYVPDLKFIEKLNKMGIDTMIDFDDYWFLPSNHLLYHDYLRDGTSKFFIEILKTFKYVSTSTKLLAQAVKEFNKNVFVMPNVISPNEPQYQYFKQPSDKLRFGYLGGTTHKPDIELLGTLNNNLMNSNLPYELILFGYDSSSAVFDYATSITSSGKYVENMKFYPKVDIDEYAAYYNLLDVALIPLVNNKFNNLKSELKLLEAGHFKKAAIVSNVMPYKPYLKDMVNCLVVNYDNGSRWFKKIKYLIKNPNLVEDLGCQLHEDMNKHFNFYKKIEERAEIYKKIHELKKSVETKI